MQNSRYPFGSFLLTILFVLGYTLTPVVSLLVLSYDVGSEILYTMYGGVFPFYPLASWALFFITLAVQVIFLILFVYFGRKQFVCFRRKRGKLNRFKQDE